VRLGEPTCLEGRDFKKRNHLKASYSVAAALEKACYGDSAPNKNMDRELK
jgi:hypothetical protein